MNRAAAYAEPVMGGWIGKFRLVWRTERFTVRTSREGPVVYFKTAAEAECAAWRVKDKIENPVMRRAGERIGAAKALANTYFKEAVGG